MSAAGAMETAGMPLGRGHDLAENGLTWFLVLLLLAAPLPAGGIDRGHGRHSP